MEKKSRVNKMVFIPPAILCSLIIAVGAVFPDRLASFVDKGQAWVTYKTINEFLEMVLYCTDFWYGSWYLLLVRGRTDKFLPEYARIFRI